VLQIYLANYSFFGIHLIHNPKLYLKTRSNFLIEIELIINLTNYYSGCGRLIQWELGHEITKRLKMNMVSRTQCRSLAKTIVSIEQEIGSEVDPNQIVHYLNDSYKLVKPADKRGLEVMIQQVTLEIPAERFAAKNTLSANTISTIGIAMTVIDRETGKLKSDLLGENTVNTKIQS